MYACKYLNFTRQTPERDLIARKTILELEGEEGEKHIEEYSDGRTDRGKALRKAISDKLGFDSLGYQNIDGVLEAIGRRHTAADILDALQSVREVGGFAVNMDLIAGLPSDSVDGFHRTLDTVLALRPENITVHTLSIKRGARLSFGEGSLPPGSAVETMLDEANRRLGKPQAPRTRIPALLPLSAEEHVRRV